MIKFKKSNKISGKITDIVTNGDLFFDEETGEAIDLAEVFYSVYGDHAFELVSSYKSDDEIDAVIEEGGDISE